MVMFCNNIIMTDKIKLSIIVPVYNAEEFLEKCLTSLVNQTIIDVEIILVDDGSTDRSLEICKAFAADDSRIRIFEQENSGQSVARNLGLDNAIGEYIAFADSDDWVDENFYEKLLEAAIRNSADIACGSVIREKKSAGKIRVNYKEEKVYLKAQEKIDAAGVPNMCYVWNKVYRTGFLKSIDLRFVNGMVFEDTDFVTRAIYYSNKIVTVPDTYYHYWTNENSTVRTMRSSDKKRLDSLRSKKSVLEFFERHKLTSNPKNLVKKKDCVKFMGLVILKTYEWETKKVYYLFGLIPILEKVSYA